MATIDAQTEAAWRQRFKQFNRFMLFMWRLGFGKWVNSMPQWSGQIMVIIHRGRKTGARRYTPVNFAELNGDLYCTAGFGPTSDWYKNVLSDPDVEVWLPDGWWSGTAEIVKEDMYRIQCLREVLNNSGFAAPLFGVGPKNMTDEELDEATSNYQLIHIRRVQPLTGPGGPGDLAWIWPAMTFFLLMILLRRRKK